MRFMNVRSTARWTTTSSTYSVLIFPHLLQIVCVLVDVPELVNDNLLIDHLDVTTSKPIDKFSPFLVSFARACVILCIDALFVRGDFFLVTNETNPSWSAACAT